MRLSSNRLAALFLVSIIYAFCAKLGFHVCGLRRNEQMFPKRNGVSGPKNT